MSVDAVLSRRLLAAAPSADGLAWLRRFRRRPPLVHRPPFAGSVASGSAESKADEKEKDKEEVAEKEKNKVKGEVKEKVQEKVKEAFEEKVKVEEKDKVEEKEKVKEEVKVEEKEKEKQKKKKQKLEGEEKLVLQEVKVSEKEKVEEKLKVLEKEKASERLKSGVKRLRRPLLMDYEPQPKSPRSSAAAKHLCVVCGDESDGLHFGQHTCRACAAFFRRTVSLRLEYSCKHNAACAIEKNARNMCRSCRFQKCLNTGMQTSAVQHARDGIGKRNEVKTRLKPSTSDSSVGLPTPRHASKSESASPKSGGPGSSGQQPPSAAYGLNGFGPAGLANALYTGYAGGAAPYAITAAPAADQTAILQIGQGLAVPQDSVPYLINNFASANLQTLTQAARQSFAAEPQDMKLLGRMLEGYHHFISLRKASYTLIEDTPRLGKSGELSQSNYGTSKKHCKIEASLLMDTVEKFYDPFGQLGQEDRYAIFDNFFCLFSNAERAYRTYKLFPEGDDRLIMPDGGYVKLQELAKFYENSPAIRGEPSQLAGIFENAMHYLISVIVSHMRQLNVCETEIIALSGIMLWRDTLKEISAAAASVVRSSREQIIRDLHAYYRSAGLYDADITLKVANLMLLMPELEQVVRLMRENYQLAAVFNIIDPPPQCKSSTSKTCS